ncbi:MmgE/PrpD family protein [Sphingomonas radiodurans]|uniref:MmgE/PrpD family protein n=1 Tax=Sphingomonas radiodurans TaxID=2890321 RepID=UPI001E574577|nr:MmgE/PrpD family protein [Sphingomonas radiodurans]WBH18008.1 MmgE/PrpD family protein [Sphingomonas radiodurans]
MSSDSLTLTERLTVHLMRPVDAASRDLARMHLLDWLGCVGAARRSPLASKLRGEPALERAAWLGNLMEMDDVHRGAILHPGPVVWPTALLSGVRDMGVLLDAAVRGYEAMIAIGATFDARHYAFFHISATAGGFGAAATAASLNDATPDDYVAAFGLAGSVAGGLWQMRREPNDAKQWHIVQAVETGLRAARLAAQGVTGPRAILDGPLGLHAATCDAPRPLMLGDRWRIEEVSFKPWGACRHAHPAIEAALELKRRGQLLGAIEVATYADAITFCDRQTPSSVIEAKFSLQHAVAIVTERGEPTLTDFEPDSFDALADARAHVTVREDAGFTARYPAHFGASVRSERGEVVLIDTLGDPERPMNRDAIVAKARALLAWGGVDGAGIDAALAAALDSNDPDEARAWIAAWA